jgi:hypothetical protein
VRQCSSPQSHECLHPAPTTPTVCCLCGPQMTTTHHIESSGSPFFGCHLHSAGHLGVFFINVGKAAIVQKPGSCLSKVWDRPQYLAKPKVVKLNLLARAAVVPRARMHPNPGVVADNQA